MGVLTDIVVASEAEAGAVGRASVPSQQWPGMDAKGIDQIKLGMLLSLLSGEPYRDSLVDEFTFLWEQSDDGPWVYRIPPCLVDRLSQLQGPELQRVAQEWARIEEFRLVNWKPADVEAVLRALVGLAEQARSQGKDLLMWMCL